MTIARAPHGPEAYFAVSVRSRTAGKSSRCWQRHFLLLLLLACCSALWLAFAASTGKPANPVRAREDSAGNDVRVLDFRFLAGNFRAPTLSTRGPAGTTAPTMTRPKVKPSEKTTPSPTVEPSKKPTPSPTVEPSAKPTASPTADPSYVPSKSVRRSPSEVSEARLRTGLCKVCRWWGGVAAAVVAGAAGAALGISAARACLSMDANGREVRHAAAWAVVAQDCHVRLWFSCDAGAPSLNVDAPVEDEPRSLVNGSANCEAFGCMAESLARALSIRYVHCCAHRNVHSSSDVIGAVGSRRAKENLGSSMRWSSMARQELAD